MLLSILYPVGRQQLVSACRFDAILLRFATHIRNKRAQRLSGGECYMKHELIHTFPTVSAIFAVAYMLDLISTFYVISVMSNLRFF